MSTTNSLPKLEQKWFTTNLLSNNKKINFRPFTVGEQKNILIVKTTSKKEIDVYLAVMDMVQNCVKDINVKEMSIVDFEKLFYDIRSVSEGNELEFIAKCEKCKEQGTYTINTQEDFTIKNKDNLKLSFTITESSEPIEVHFKQPTMNDSIKIEKRNIKRPEEKGFETIAACLEKVVHGEKVITDFTHDDALEFINSLPSTYFSKLDNFFNNAPSVVCKNDIVCSTEGCDHIIVPEGTVVSSFLS